MLGLSHPNDCITDGFDPDDEDTPQHDPFVARIVESTKQENEYPYCALYFSFLNSTGAKPKQFKYRYASEIKVAVVVQHRPTGHRRYYPIACRPETTNAV
eukprot:Awhi_evm1s1206